MVSNNFKKLKAEIDKVKVGIPVDLEPLCMKCKPFIEGIILDGINSSNEVFSSYCSYVSMLNIRYICSDFIARVCEDGSRLYLDVNPIGIVDMAENEDQVIFILAHEVKHLLFKHIIKYRSLYREEVTALFLNLAADVEVNESLKGEFFHTVDYAVKRNMSDAVPKSIFDMFSMADLLEIEEKTLRHDCAYVANKYTMADFLYKKLNKKCQAVLGYSINEILYNCIINERDFVNELFAVVEGTEYKVFNIYDSVSAINFCKKLVQYLRKKVYIPCIVLSNSTNTMSGSGKGDSGSNGNGASGKGAGSGSKNSNSNENNSKSRLEGGEEDNSGSSEIREYVQLKNGLGVFVTELPDEALDDLISDMEGSGYIVVNNIKPQKGRSGVGSGFTQNVSFKPSKTRVPWQNVLDRIMSVLSEKYEETHRRLNRRQPNRIELSGRKRRLTLQLVVGRDNSGSISNPEYNYFTSEILKIAKKYECDLHLYEFTTRVEKYAFYKGETLKHQTADSLGGSMRYSGGTTFQPVFDAVNENKKIRNRECLLVMFTDGEGEIHVDTKGIKNRFWVVTGDSLSCKESEGNVFKIVDLGE